MTGTILDPPKGTTMTTPVDRRASNRARRRVVATLAACGVAAGGWLLLPDAADACTPGNWPAWCGPEPTTTTEASTPSSTTYQPAVTSTLATTTPTTSSTAALSTVSTAPTPSSSSVPPSTETPAIDEWQPLSSGTTPTESYGESSPSSSATPSGSPAPAQPTATSSSTGLPATGSTTGDIAWIALWVLGGGGLMLGIANFRRKGG